MIASFAPVLLVAIIGALFIFGTFFASFVIRPKVPFQEKSLIYDCGELPVGGAWVNSNIRFYIIALIFLIFEVEVAFMYPVAVVYRKWISGEGGLSGMAAYLEILAFAGILFVAVIYAWAKGDFEWVKNVGKTRFAGPDSNAVPVNLRKDYHPQ